ncbi:SufE family protein [Bartonella sp. TP]|uniref:SufE family protein n=1 Tax=Bartonella sp. TP TaxID=3057550 RepID=UPI0025AED0D4|nr:SufE family protein [Bartonella sp. TP]MDN5249098.1 SufE family protein [Alphaproteobacteria bacterium]WJW80176.1 SufE family protein [Bartonella sp. TP]
MDHNIQTIEENFELLDNWEDRYRYLIELGSYLASMPSEAYSSDYKISGCQSQVWLYPQLKPEPHGTQSLNFLGDSDAHIVKGLLYIILTFYNGKTIHEALNANIDPLLQRLDLAAHLSQQRTGGVKAIIKHIKNYIATKGIVE